MVTHTATIWTTLKALKALIDADDILKMITVEYKPREDDVFPGDVRMYIYPTSWDNEGAGLGSGAMTRTYLGEAELMIPFTDYDDNSMVSDYPTALEEMVETYPDLNSTPGVHSFVIRSGEYDYAYDDLLFYIIVTMTFETEIH